MRHHNNRHQRTFILLQTPPLALPASTHTPSRRPRRLALLTEPKNVNRTTWRRCRFSRRTLPPRNLPSNTIIAIFLTLVSWDYSIPVQWTTSSSSSTRSQGSTSDWAACSSPSDVCLRSSVGSASVAAVGCVVMSNSCTAVVDTIAEHPMRSLRRATSRHDEDCRRAKRWRNPF